MFERNNSILGSGQLSLTITAKAFAFDMDGTIVDSTDLIGRLWREWAAKHKLDADPILRAAPGRKAIDIVRQFGPPGINPEVEAGKLAASAARETIGLREIAGAKRFLKSLPLERWAIVTSAERKLADRWLSFLQFPRPSVLITSEDVNNGKPSPDGYLLATKQLGYRPEDLVAFEDSDSGLKAALAAGLRSVAIGKQPMPSVLCTIADFSQVGILSSDQSHVRISLGV